VSNSAQQKPLHSLVVGDDSSGQRLDVVASKLSGLSRSSIKHYLATSNLKVARNGQEVSVERTNFKVLGGDRLTIFVPQKEALLPPDIIYKDPDVVVINKPRGILTHSRSTDFQAENTVIELVAHLVKSGTTRGGIVHRLDRFTSGVMVIARNERSRHYLMKQFSQRKVKKLYIALCEGHLENKRLELRWPLLRDPKKPARFIVSHRGKPAVSEISESFGNEHFSLVKISPLSGRTHQIRVHLSHLGHPIVGDQLYGSTVDTSVGYLLHAQQLKIDLEGQGMKTFKAPLPIIMKQFIDLKIGNTANVELD